MSERNNFIKGTVILICANAIAKILGAVFKIPLTYILQEDGMAVYSTAFSAYMVFLSLVTSGFPFAATKLLSEYTATGKNDRIRPVVRAVGMVLFTIGSVASIVMYIFAPKLALLMREPSAANAIRAISPSVMLVAVGAIYKSSNEARADYLQTAFSQVTEAAVKLFLGLYLAYKLSPISLLKAADGAVLSVSIGEAFATGLLFIMWRISVRKLPAAHFKKSELRTVFSIALPMLLTGSAIGLLSMAEVSTVRAALSGITFTPKTAEQFLLKYSSFTDAFDNLTESLALTQNGVRKLYGGFSGYAQTVFNLPVGIIATVSAAATPMFAKALMCHDSDEVVNGTKKVSSIILTLVLPSAALCFFFSEDILYLLFGNRFSADMLISLAPSLIFLCLANMITAILHLSGKIFEPFLALSCGMILKIILSAIVIRIPEINILGAGLASTISSLFILVGISFVYKSHFGAFPPFIKQSVIPIFATCVMIGIMKPFSVYFSYRINSRLAFMACCPIGALGYIFAIILFKKTNCKN